MIESWILAMSIARSPEDLAGLSAFAPGLRVQARRLPFLPSALPAILGYRGRACENVRLRHPAIRPQRAYDASQAFDGAAPAGLEHPRGVRPDGEPHGIADPRWWGFHWLRKLQSVSPPRAAVLERVEFELVDAGGVRCEWCRPQAATPGRTLVYLHGGGYVLGSVDSSRELIARLAVGTGAAVLAPNYRLAPEHRFPAASDDCEEVYRWLLEQGVSADHIALAGDSAGAALCVELLCKLRDTGGPLPLAALLFSPWVDPVADGGSMREQEPFDTIDRDFLRRCITTYLDDDDPVISFEGAPYLVGLSNDIQETTDRFWSLLDEDNKVAILTKFIDPVTNTSEIHIQNRFEGKA